MVLFRCYLLFGITLINQSEIISIFQHRTDQSTRFPFLISIELLIFGFPISISIPIELFIFLYLYRILIPIELPILWFWKLFSMNYRLIVLNTTAFLLHYHSLSTISSNSAVCNEQNSVLYERLFRNYFSVSNQQLRGEA